MVTSGTHVNGGCCFDYGNSETDRHADGAGAMDAIYFSTSCWFGGCSGSGPWVQADLEYGLYSGGSQSWNSNQRAFTQPLRHRDAEEQRDFAVRAQGRRRAIRRFDDVVERLSTAGLQPDAAAGRHHPGQRRRLLRLRRRQPEPGDLLRGRHHRRLPQSTPRTTRSRPTSPRPATAAVPPAAAPPARCTPWAPASVWTMPNSSTTGGTQLQINACAGGANQVFAHTSSGQLTVYSGSTQMCLDANGQGTSRRHQGDHLVLQRPDPISSGTSTPTARSPAPSQGSVST